MGRKKIITIVQDKIHPYKLNEKGKSHLAQMERDFSYNITIESIDIGVSQYLKYDADGAPTCNSVEIFLAKLGGIANNRSLSRIDQELLHLINIAKQKFQTEDMEECNVVLQDYVTALKKSEWTESQIVEDLKEDSRRLLYKQDSIRSWIRSIESWIEDIYHWTEMDSFTIEQNGTILPEAVFDGLQNNFQSLCKQINASYEQHLYDATAVLMRRVLEGLLVLAFQNNKIESTITNKSGRHFPLDKIIQIAIENTTLSLSANTKYDMHLFKDLGNYSAHKIWYNAAKDDLEPHLLKYRAIIEELIYKAKLKEA